MSAGPPRMRRRDTRRGARARRWSSGPARRLPCAIGLRAGQPAMRFEGVGRTEHQGCARTSSARRQCSASPATTSRLTKTSRAGGDAAQPPAVTPGRNGRLSRMAARNWRPTRGADVRPGASSSPPASTPSKNLRDAPYRPRLICRPMESGTADVCAASVRRRSARPSRTASLTKPWSDEDLTARRKKNSARVDLARPVRRLERWGSDSVETARKPGFRPERETARMEGWRKGSRSSPPRPARDRHTDRCRLGKGALWAGRIMSGLAILFLAFDASATAAAGSCHRGVYSARIPCERRLRLGVVPARLCRHVCDSTHLHPGGDPADGLSRRRDCHPCAGRNPLFSHTLFRSYVAL